MAQKSARHWVEKFSMEAHPFMGGYFKETFRDEMEVEGGEPGNRGPRAASTLIYFLHFPSQKLDGSATFHKLQSAVVTHFYTGETVSVYTLKITEQEVSVDKALVGPEHDFQHIVPAGTWFTRVLESQEDDLEDPEDLDRSPYALVGVSLAPGFDFNDMKTATLDAIKESLSK